MSRPSNKFEMTGQERFPSIAGKRNRYPWPEMEVGDWFASVADAFVIASLKNKRQDKRRYKGVSTDGMNCVVRVK